MSSVPLIMSSLRLRSDFDLTSISKIEVNKPFSTLLPQCNCPSLYTWKLLKWTARNDKTTLSTQEWKLPAYAGWACPRVGSDCVSPWLWRTTMTNCMQLLAWSSPKQIDKGPASNIFLQFAARSDESACSHDSPMWQIPLTVNLDGHVKCQKFYISRNVA